MTSRIQRRKQAAARKEVYVYFRGSVPKFYVTQLDKYDVYVEDERGFRDLALTYRQAVALAYSISISKKHDVIFTFM